MGRLEYRIPFDELEDSTTITERNKQLFQEHGHDLQQQECDTEDDHKLQERVYKIQPERKYFFQGGK